MGDECAYVFFLYVVFEIVDCDIVVGFSFSIFTIGAMRSLYG